jgi:hypothetical protein
MHATLVMLFCTHAGRTPFGPAHCGKCSDLRQKFSDHVAATVDPAQSRHHAEPASPSWLGTGTAVDGTCGRGSRAAHFGVPVPCSLDLIANKQLSDRVRHVQQCPKRPCGRSPPQPADRSASSPLSPIQPTQIRILRDVRPVSMDMQRAWLSSITVPSSSSENATLMTVPSTLTATSVSPFGAQAMSVTPAANALRTTSSGLGCPCGHTLKLLSCDPVARYCCSTAQE